MKLIRLACAVALTVTACTSTETEATRTTQTATTDVSTTGSSTSGSSTTGPSTTASSTDTPTSGSEPSGGQPVEVQVFFNVNDPDECSAVEGRSRTVLAGVEAARYAFDELVKGPLPSETLDGAFSFFSAETTGTVRTAEVEGERLVVDFDDLRVLLGPTGASTSCGSAALLGQLHATAFQFTDVNLVRYELEGSCDNFGEWLQRDCIEVERSEWETAVEHQLPGAPFDGILPVGAVLGVVGVEADDVLNVRSLPGSRQAIVSTLEPTATGITFTGRERLVGEPTSIWYEVDAGSEIGWVNSRFVAPLAGVTDVTSEVVAVVGDIPSAETSILVAQIVIDARLRNVDSTPTVVLVDGPRSGPDVDEVTFDILGFHDDSVRGERLHLFISPQEDAEGSMALKSAEATTICVRGGGQTELCP